MTVSATTSRWAYTGNGVTTAFTYDNLIFASTDLKVYLDGVLQTLTTHYSVSGALDEDGGEVTFVTAPSNGASVVIVRDVPATQLTAIADGDAFPASVVNRAFDKLDVLSQQLEAAVGRTLRQPDSDAADLDTLPVKASRASKFLAFDADGDPIAAAGTSANLGPVSAFVDTLLPAASAAAFLATLGAYSSAATDALLSALTLRRLWLNADMEVGQRGAPGLTTSYAYGKVDRWAGRASGGAVSAGSITQSSSSAASASGNALHFSGVTLTGAGKLAARYRMEAKDARKLKNQTYIWGCNLWHDIGSAKNATIAFNKANSADDFSAVTAIATSGNLSIADQAKTAISFSSALGDCSNGLEVTVELDSGAITTKNWHLGEVRHAIGAALPSFAPRDFAEELLACERYYEKTFAYATPPAQAATFNGALLEYGTGQKLVATWKYRARKRVDPTLTTYNPAIANANWRDATAAADVTVAVITDGSDEDHASIGTATSPAGSNAVYIHVTAEAEL